MMTSSPVTLFTPTAVNKQDTDYEEDKDSGG